MDKLAVNEKKLFAMSKCSFGTRFGIEGASAGR
jgi:hypothetical protein